PCKSFRVYHCKISLQNATVLSATASSLNNFIALARPATASGSRAASGPRLRSASASEDASSGGTVTPASPTTSGITPAVEPTTTTSCAIASTSTCPCGSLSPPRRAGTASTSSPGHRRVTTSGGSAP